MFNQIKTTEYTEQKCLKSPYFLPLIFAALWNITIGGVGLYIPEYSISLLIVEATTLTALMTKQSFWLLVMLAGVGYGLVAFKPNKYRFFITIGGILKVGVFLLLGYLWLNSKVSFICFLLGIGDLLWAIYFCYFLRLTKRYGYC